jgi:hypothetical protein
LLSKVTGFTRCYFFAADVLVGTVFAFAFAFGCGVALAVLALPGVVVGVFKAGRPMARSPSAF